MEGRDGRVKEEGLRGALEDVELLGHDVAVFRQSPADQVAGSGGVDADAFVVDGGERERGGEQADLAKEVVSPGVHDPGIPVGQTDDD